MNWILSARGLLKAALFIGKEKCRTGRTEAAACGIAEPCRKREEGTDGGEGGLGRGSSTATTPSSACSTRRRAVQLQCSARLGKQHPALENVVGRLKIAVGAGAVRW